MKASTYTGNGTTNDEGRGIRSNSGDQATNLEDEDGTKIGNLDIEKLVDGSVHGLQGRSGEQIGRAIPTLYIDVSYSLFPVSSFGLTMSLTLLYSAVMAPRAGAIIV